MAVVNGIKFLYQFSVGEFDVNNPGNNVISVTSTAPGDHDKVNLTTTPLRETWRSSSASVAQEIVIQANDTSVIPDIFALLNHNLTSDAVVHVYGNNSNTWGAPAFTGLMIWNKKHMVLSTAPNAAYVYYKFRILDAGNPCDYIEIGRIIAGKSVTLASNEDIADDFGAKTNDLAYVMPSEGFFRAFNERVKVQALSLTFPELQTRSPNDTNYRALLDLGDFVGITLPFLTMVDPDDPYFKLVWGNFSAIPEESYTVNRYVTLQAEILEVF